MNDPEQEISGVIHRLTQTPPSIQAETIDRYFLPDACFTHPFCRTGNNRLLIHGIYRWYKILSPRIDLKINRITYDKEALLIYANISQIFRIWFIPFHKAPVTFVTVIALSHDARTSKYYIKSQDDLYQVDQWVLFLPGIGGHALVWLWQLFVSWQCLLLCYLFWPVTWFEENVFKNGWRGLAKEGASIDEIKRDKDRWDVTRD